MSLSIISAWKPEHQNRSRPKTAHLDVAEFFCDTIQGENFVGWPAAFLRLQFCTMDCVWCDTNEVWRYGNPYTFDELFKFMDMASLPEKLHKGQHLVLTGGSPLNQQDRLIKFIDAFIHTYGFKPYIEVENECTISPLPAFIKHVDLWNNSPKLDNSGNLRIVRYQPNILMELSKLENSWFKFVISDPLTRNLSPSCCSNRVIDKDIGFIISKWRHGMGRMEKKFSRCACRKLS